MSHSLNDVVLLSPKTHKAKNRLKEWGDQWIIVAIKGDRLAVVALKEEFDKVNPFTAKSVRWVDKDDIDFAIKETSK